MLEWLKQLSKQLASEPGWGGGGGRAPAPRAEHPYQIAAVVLMIEASQADESVLPEERLAIESAIREALDLDGQKLESLLAAASESARAATSLYEFTSVLNRDLGQEQKVLLVKMLWRIAFADGNVDRFEEHFIRKTANLLHVRHSQFIRTKLVAATEHEASRRKARRPGTGS